MGTDRPLILFDGVCNLCNHSIQFIIRRDKKSIFHFASLQSPYGILQLQNLNIAAGEFTSIILIADKIKQKSDAVLEIARCLSGAWPALYIFKIVPRFVRDWIYDLIAQNRYKLFGRKDQCMIPTPELKAKFIE